MDDRIVANERRGASGLDEGMRLSLAQEAEARAAFYRMLSSLYFKELDQEGIDRLAEADLTGTGIDDELMQQGYADLAASLRHRDGGTRQELAADFAGAILAAGSYEERRATPYESVFMSETGLLMQEARDDVYRRFCEARVAVDEGLRTPEDHLSFEFEFMAAQADRLAQALRSGRAEDAAEALRMQRSFHLDHLLNWIDAFCDCLDACARTRFYRGVSKLTRGFVRLDEGLMREASEVLC
ncbi:TorD/DmsD family molecular chaperone [Arabiibacter massiliensis]|uniref:TorD/DmsD family molecular chaperone n=1 Tax=Arabiibacter massiliensis TaxID=1870985 RepID=UPI00155B19B0|nr:molecular chaperone TorD family protein [Arabiibacter massiliensis]